MEENKAKAIVDEVNSRFAEQKIKRREAKKRRVNNFKVAGLCAQGCRRPAVKDRTMCEVCLLKLRERARKRRAS